MLVVINSLLPIILIVALGAFLVRIGFMAQAMCQGLDRLVYHILLPLAIIAGMMNSQLLSPEAGWLSLGLTLATLAIMLVAYAVGMILRLRAHQMGVLVQASFRGNVMYVGLPVILYAYHDQPQAAAMAILAIAPLIVIYNVLAVTVLSAGSHPRKRDLVIGVVRGVIRNPLIIACVIGAVLSLLPWRMPQAVDESITVLGKTAAPLALLSLGGGLMFLPVRGSLGPAITASILKTAVTPLLFLGCAWLLKLDEQATRLGLIVCATPNAVVSYIITTQFGRDAALAAASVVVSTIMSFGVLAAVLLLTA